MLQTEPAPCLNPLRLPCLAPIPAQASPHSPPTQAPASAQIHLLGPAQASRPPRPRPAPRPTRANLCAKTASRAGESGRDPVREPDIAAGKRSEPEIKARRSVNTATRNDLALDFPAREAVFAHKLVWDCGMLGCRDCTELTSGGCCEAGKRDKDAGRREALANGCRYLVA